MTGCAPGRSWSGRGSAGVPRTKPASERRAELLDGARSVFVAKGVAAATLEDITNAAGVSKGLFWQYFRSKDDLVAALQHEYSAQFAHVVRAAVAAVPDWPGKLDACVQACFDQFQLEKKLHDVLFRHPAHVMADLGHEPAHHVLVEAIRALLADGTAAGAFDVTDPEEVAYLLYATMHAFDPAFRGSNRTPDDQLVSAAQQLFRRSVGAADPEGAANQRLTAGGACRAAVSSRAAPKLRRLIDGSTARASRSAKAASEPRGAAGRQHMVGAAR
jgi:TetR/AcrR family transcriptional regulator, transcriptional repressor for nem operon